MRRHRQFLRSFTCFCPRAVSTLIGLGLGFLLALAFMGTNVAAASGAEDATKPVLFIQSRHSIRERSLLTPAPTALVVTVVRPMMAHDLPSTELKSPSTTTYRGRTLLRERR
jgi:hypothetical protein